MASPEEQRGDDFVTQADARLKSWSLFSSASSKFEDAAELLEKAGNNYKMAKNWAKASGAFKRKAELEIKLEHHYSAATAFTAAADMLKAVHPDEALALFDRAIPLHGEGGKFGAAAKVCETMAELLESLDRLEDAVAKYRQAADYFEGEKSTSRAGKCREKVACHLATLEQYPEAVQIFEQLGTEALGNNLLKFGAKKHFLHASFCLLARGDHVAAQQAVERYAQQDYSFEGSREQKLIVALVQACEEFDSTAFATELYQFDSMTKLNPWETSILLRVKKGLEQNEGGDADELR